MWSYGLDLRSIRLIAVEMFLCCEGTCNYYLFFEV